MGQALDALRCAVVLTDGRAAAVLRAPKM